MTQATTYHQNLLIRPHTKPYTSKIYVLPIDHRPTCSTNIQGHLKEPPSTEKYFKGHNSRLPNTTCTENFGTGYRRETLFLTKIAYWLNGPWRRIGKTTRKMLPMRNRIEFARIRESAQTLRKKVIKMSSWFDTLKHCTEQMEQTSSWTRNQERAVSCNTRVGAVGGNSS